MWLEEHRWHYDYARLAWDSGFTFDKHKQPNLDKNKICLIDIDRVVKERDVTTVEQFLTIVIGYVLDNDQAGILDTSFVKVFRMSQLAVEYLLFCKKYLDNTVVLLKKDIAKLKEEVNELKSYNHELENHLSMLSKHNLTASFKCEKCMKMFSSEDYLNSHIKRRHIDENKITLQERNPETDQLQMEIKELKERLNTTEKMLKDKGTETEHKSVDKVPNEEIQDIHRKFERFKEQVENEIATLQLEKKFYEEKYNKLFDLIIQMRDKEPPQSVPSKVSEVCKSEKKTDHLAIVTIQDHFDYKEPVIQKKLDTATFQNSISERKPKQMEIVTIQDFHDIQNNDTRSESEESEEKEKIEKKISEMTLALESKISSGLATIQNQMETFWEKLNEIEVTKQESKEKTKLSVGPDSGESYQTEPGNRFTADVVLENQTGSSHILPVQIQQPSLVKPKIKPRTKLSQPTTVTHDKTDNPIMEKIKTELKLYTPQHHPLTTVKSGKPQTIDSSDESKECFEEKPVTVEKPAPRISTRSVKKDVHERRVRKIQEQIEDSLRIKFEQIGVSIDWKGIPAKSFERALQLIRHQATDSKKSYPKYDSIKKSIEKKLKIFEPKKEEKQHVKPKQQKKDVTETQSKLSYLRRLRVVKQKPKSPRSKDSKPVITIKNKDLYKTDSESEQDVNIYNDAKERPLELTVLPSKTTMELLQNTDSDLQSVTFSDEQRPKSAPDGAPVKKKVVFDVQPSTETDKTNTAHQENKRDDKSADSDFS